MRFRWAASVPDKRILRPPHVRIGLAPEGGDEEQGSLDGLVLGKGGDTAHPPNAVPDEGRHGTSQNEVAIAGSSSSHSHFHL